MRCDQSSDPIHTEKEGNPMSVLHQTFSYYKIRFDASHERDLERGEVSATTVVMAAALVALAIAVGAIISTRVRDKANALNLG